MEGNGKEVGGDAPREIPDIFSADEIEHMQKFGFQETLNIILSKINRLRSGIEHAREKLHDEGEARRLELELASLQTKADWLAEQLAG